MALNERQRARVDRAQEVFMQQRKPGGDTADVIHELAQEVGQLRFWLADMMLLVDEIDRARPVTDAEAAAAIPRRQP